MAHRLVPRDEPELADRLGQILRREGVDLHLSTSATAVRPGGDGVIVETDDARVHRRRPDRRHRPPRQHRVARARTARRPGRTTTAPRSTAATARWCRASTSWVTPPSGAPTSPTSRRTTPCSPCATCSSPAAERHVQLTPWCTFTEPELAHVGLTAAEARERHGRGAVAVHRHELAHNDRARADGTTDGHDPRRHREGQDRRCPRTWHQRPVS